MPGIDKYTAGGALGGALLGAILYGTLGGRRRGLLGYLGSMLAGGLAGGAAGRVLRGHNDFTRRSAAARDSGSEAPVKGRMYFVSHPRNSIDTSGTGIGWVDGLSGAIRDKTGWDGNAEIGHAGLLTVDEAGNATMYDYGKYGRPVPELLTARLPNVLGKSPDEIARIVQSHTGRWGGDVDIVGSDVADIGVGRRYLQSLVSGGDKPSFDPLPGGYNCGSASRAAFDASTGDGTSHVLDLLWGGFPGANMPSRVKYRGTYRSGAGTGASN